MFRLEEGHSSSSLGPEAPANPIYGDSKDWWILGTTNYTVVDPSKLTTRPGELKKKNLKPQKLQRPLGMPSLSGSVSGAAALEPIDQGSSKDRLSRPNGIVAGSRDDCLQSGRGSNVEWKPLDAATRTESDSSCGALSPGLASGTASSSSSSSYASSKQRSSASHLSGLMISPSRSHVGPQHKMTFRANFQQRPVDARPRRYSDGGPFLSSGSKLVSVRVLSRLTLSEPFDGRVRSMTSDITADGDSREDASQGAASTGGLSKESSRSSPIRKLAMKRLQKSLNRMPITASPPSEAAQADRLASQAADFEPHGPCDRATRAMEQLDQQSRLLLPELRSLEAAALGVDEVAELMGLDPEGGSQGKASAELSRDSEYAPGFDLVGFLRESSADQATFKPDPQRPHSEGENGSQRRQKRLQCVRRLVEHMQAASGCEEVRIKRSGEAVSLALVAYEELMHIWDSRSGGCSVLLPAAVASVACATVYSICALVCSELTAQTLHGQLMRYGLVEASKEANVQYNRYSDLHASLQEHQQLLNNIAVRIVNLVQVQDSEAPAPPVSNPKPQGAPQRGLPYVNIVAPEESAPPADSWSPPQLEREDIISLMSAAQAAISAAHEAAGLQGEAVGLDFVKVQQPLQLHSPRLSLRAAEQKCAFSLLEMRLLMSKVLVIRVALSDLGCTGNAWSAVESFKNIAASSLNGMK
ncbi:hypothetical protein Efla_000987 [Eimeria flavescens]